MYSSCPRAVHTPYRRASRRNLTTPPTHSNESGQSSTTRRATSDQKGFSTQLRRASAENGGMCQNNQSSPRSFPKRVWRQATFVSTFATAFILGWFLLVDVTSVGAEVNEPIPPTQEAVSLTTQMADCGSFCPKLSCLDRCDILEADLIEMCQLKRAMTMVTTWTKPSQTCKKEIWPQVLRCAVACPIP